MNVSCTLTVRNHDKIEWRNNGNGGKERSQNVVDGTWISLCGWPCDFVCRKEPDLELEGLLKRHSTTVKFFQGSMMNAVDLARVKVDALRWQKNKTNRTIQQQQQNNSFSPSLSISLFSFSSIYPFLLYLLFSHSLAPWHNNCLPYPLASINNFFSRSSGIFLPLYLLQYHSFLMKKNIYIILMMDDGLPVSHYIGDKDWFFFNSFLLDDVLSTFSWISSFIFNSFRSFNVYVVKTCRERNIPALPGLKIRWMMFSIFFLSFFFWKVDG